MAKKLMLIIVILFLIFIFLFSQEPESALQSEIKKKIFLYFIGEEAGFEEYEWIEQEDKFVLSTKGEMNKPISLITELMTIELDREFKPLRFYFKGSVRGVSQEIESTVADKEVKSRIKVGEQTSEMTSKISPDALLLPNGIFAPYVVLAKKVKDSGKEKMTIPAYIVPQLEVSLSVVPDTENPHLFNLILAGVNIELLTDEQGYIESLSIPSQSIQVYKEKLKKEELFEGEGIKEGISHELVVQGSKVGKGFYSLQETEEGILIQGETQQAVSQVSLNFQFEERLSPDWNLKEAMLKGKVNDEKVELESKIDEGKIKALLKQGEKVIKKEFPFSPDIIFSTGNPLVDNLLLVKKAKQQKIKKLYALTKSWGSHYLDEPLLLPITIEREGEDILSWKEKDIKTTRYFADLAGANGGYIWADKEKVIKTSLPFAAMDVYHQDYVGLKTKEVLSPVITSEKYTSEEVSYPSEKIKLAGTLTIPKDNRSKHPAAILISGSGPQDRNEDTVGPGGLKFGIFKQIAHQLSENGIAVLRYDDRGVGKSEGNFMEAGQEDLIQDVKAGVSYLRTRDDILDDGIALIGHSEGGIIAPRVAAEDPKIRAIVLMAGTAETGDKVLREQFNFVLDSMELSEEEKEKFRASYENVLKIIRGEPVEKEIEEKLKPQIEPQLKWLRSFVSYEPLSVLDKIKASVLIINGGKDKQVFPHHARKLYHRLEELDKAVTLKIFPDLNHLLIPSKTGAYAEYARQLMGDRKISQDLLGYLLGWLHGVLYHDQEGRVIK
ncbi:MAG: alpha/beta fold hydrolase [Candidatus Aminicenantes bacterium]|nr:alpha/beta fold hydrolase [Candidatus Aminicenantes bacterium]